MQENLTPIAPEVTPQIVVEQPKQSNFLVILLSVLLLISVLIAGFFAYQTQKLVKELQGIRSEKKTAPVATTEPIAEPIATNSATVTSDPTVNWKMYTNEKYTFKYPPRLMQDKNGKVGGTFLGDPKITVSFADQLTVRDGTDAPFDGFTVYQIYNTEDSLENFIKKEIIARKNSPRGILEEKFKTILAANKTIYYIDAEQNIRQYFIPSINNSIILFSTVRQTDSFILDLNQILSTFKFTN